MKSPINIIQIVNKTATDDLVEFLNENSNGVAILDSTNPTHERRKQLIAKIRPTGAKIMFIEVKFLVLLLLMKEFFFTIHHIILYFHNICPNFI